MLPNLQLNDVVVAKNLMVYYYKSKTMQVNNLQMKLFATSNHMSLIQSPEEYFEHKVSDDHYGSQYMTDNFDLVLRQGSYLSKGLPFPKFHHYAKDINAEVVIEYSVNVARHNNKPVLFIKNLAIEQCKSLYDKIIKLHEVLWWKTTIL